MFYFASHIFRACYDKSNGFTLQKTLQFDKSAIMRGAEFSGIKSVKEKKGVKNLNRVVYTGNVTGMSPISAKFMLQFTCLSTDYVLGLCKVMQRTEKENVAGNFRPVGGNSLKDDSLM